MTDFPTTESSTVPATSSGTKTRTRARAKTNSSWDKPRAAANEFVLAVANARNRASQRSVASTDEDVEAQSSSGNRKCAKMLKFVGFLDAESSDRPRRLYLTESMKSGVDVENDAIVYHTQLPASDEDGLQRDAIWVSEDDVTYWSKEPPKKDDPNGGGGTWPLYGPPI